MNDTSVKAKQFVVRSNVRGLIAVAQDWLLLAALFSIGIYFDHWAAYVILAWPIGLIQFAIGEALAHEASHYNLFRSRRWNDWAEWGLSIPFLFALSDYRHEHRLHHTKIGESEDHLVADYRARGLFNTPLRLAWIWLGKPLLGIAGLHYLKSVLFELSNIRSGIKIAFFWAVLIGSCIATGNVGNFAWLWILPLCWTYPAFLWWSEIRDHFNTKCGTRTDTGWLNVLTHNNGYHYVHHKYPSIPWYRLREAHHALCAEEAEDICHGLFDAFRQLTPKDETEAATD